MLNNKIALVAMAVFFVSSCSFMPASGPYGSTVTGEPTIRFTPGENDSDSKEPMKYVLIDMKDNLPTRAGEGMHSAPDSQSWLPKGVAEEIKVSVGDTLKVTLFETESGGLFLGDENNIRPGNYITLPPQTIDHTGNIRIPYAGLIEAAGKTPSQIEGIIVSRLQNKAIEPQAVVTFEERRGAEVTVIGAVNDARRYPLNFNGETLLDAIARAGGPSAPAYDTYVSLQRDGVEQTIYMDDLVRNPERNVYLKPGDTVYLYSQPKVFNVFGASGFNGRHSFNKRQIMLDEALGRADGLRDNQADPSEVYVFRHEPVEYLQSLGLDFSGKGTWPANVPTAYKFDLREPSGYFLTQNFEVENKDIIYIANAEAVELLKLLRLINPGSVTTINTREASGS